MALVTKITHLTLQTNSKHTDVDCTYDIVTDAQGNRFLQLDTYGSAGRDNPGKKSQSVRLSPKALQQLKSIIATHKL
jgi:hypothetical protein